MKLTVTIKLKGGSRDGQPYTYTLDSVYPRYIDIPQYSAVDDEVREHSFTIETYTFYSYDGEEIVYAYEGLRHAKVIATLKGR